MEGIMLLRYTLVIFIALVPLLPSFGQTPWQFRWKKGEALTYKVKHVTTVSEAVEATKSETHSKLDLVKRWSITAVDEQGIATLEMSLVAMRNEQKRVNGDTL